MTTVKKMLISFTAGAILGILYAPARGAKTRKKIAGLGNDIKDGWNSILDRVTDRIDRAKESVDHFADNTIEKIESAQFTVNDKAGYL